MDSYSLPDLRVYVRNKQLLGVAEGKEEDEYPLVRKTLWEDLSADHIAHYLIEYSAILLLLTVD